MKKVSLFLELLMALLVMSCSKDETLMSIPQESDAIAFGTYVGRDAQTRAAVTDLDKLKTADIGFGVFAYYTNGGDYTVGTSTPNFMYNQKVNWNTTNKWEYSPVKYWPNENTDKLTFFAYAPHSTVTNSNITTLSAKTASGEPTLLFTVNSDAKKQSDLLYADATNLKNLTKQTIGGTVSFPFKHALSRIGFKVEVMSDKVNDDAPGTHDAGSVTSDSIASGTVVSVQKVELIGTFATSNTFNFAAGSWGTPTTGSVIYSLDYNATETNPNFISSVAEKVTTSLKQLNADDSYLMIIPKNLANANAGEGVKIRVTYKVTTADTALDGGSSEVTNVITSDEFAFNFEKGKAYSFNLHLGLTSVKFSASVTDWDPINPAGTVVNVPINTGTNPSDD